MTEAFMMYCDKCDRKVRVRTEQGAGCVTWTCIECGEVLDRDYDDDGYDGDNSQDNPHRKFCWHCNGEQYGIIGDDWDSDDPINGPYPGEITKCPCCHGSGKAEDETFW